MVYYELFFFFLLKKNYLKKVLFKLLSFDTVTKEDIQYNMMVCCTTTWTLGLEYMKDCLHLSTKLFITNKAAFQLQPLWLFGC